MFLLAFNNISIILNLLTNRNIVLIYSVTICKQKTKDCERSRSLQVEVYEGLYAVVEVVELTSQ